MEPIPIILLCALPASGKSETRTFLDSLSPEDLRANFSIGQTVQLDDYPYVHMMREFDVALQKVNQPRRFFISDQDCFKDGFEWATLILMLNDDYEDLVHRRMVPEANPTRYLMERIDRARIQLGRPAHFAELPAPVVDELCKLLDEESLTVVKNKNAGVPETLEGKTVVIEFARGGAHGSPFPIPAPQGYEFSLKHLSREILSKCSMLYIWVTPEQSREKNFARAKPNSDGSILFHGVPINVMMGDYGCDDIDHLLGASDRPNTIKVEKAAGEHFYIPVGRLDNRVDLTTFARKKKENWEPEEVARIRAAMASAFANLLGQYRALHAAH